MDIGKSHVSLAGLGQQFLVIGNIEDRNPKRFTCLFQFDLGTRPPDSMTANQYGSLALLQGTDYGLQVIWIRPGPWRWPRRMQMRSFV